MAIAFARVSIHTRSKGHSAVAGAAYRAGERLLDSRTGETHDFKNRGDVKFDRILLPEGADPIFLNREHLWNAVEGKEKRKDSQVAKDIILALPRNLDFDHQKKLATCFAQKHFVDRGVVADVAIHDHGDGNPHAHVYVTTRRLIGREFDRYKARDLNPTFANSRDGRGFVSEQEYWGEQWRAFQNEYFKMHSIDLIVDENHLIAQDHEGRIRYEDEHYIRQTNELKKQAGLEIALTDPERLLKTLSQRHAVFSERQLASLIFKSTTTQEQFQTAMIKVKTHPSIICLGPNEEGRLCYTTRFNYRTEIRLTKAATALLKHRSHALSDNIINQVAANYTLSDEQSMALNSICQGHDISLLVGRAGTGKSYLMRAANDTWSRSGYRVTGVAVSGVAAKGLKSSSNISSMTIASFKFRLENNLFHLDQNDVLVMDEAGMTNLHDMAFVIDHVNRAGAKLVLIGDPDQLQPIGPGATFRALAEHIGFTELHTIRRQKDSLDCKASEALALGNVDDAIAHYEAKDRLHWHDCSLDAMNAIISSWSTDLSTDALSERLILAHRNDDIAQLNELARNKMRELGFLDDKTSQFQVVSRHVGQDDWSIKYIPAEISLSVGDRILFRKNDSKLNVVNGDFATITGIHGNDISVLLDDDKKLTFNIKDYNEFTYGYAATVHKSQGVTKDRVYVYAGGQGWNRHLAYVALTRHRDHVEMHMDRENFESEHTFKQHLHRESDRDSILDWPLAYATRRGFDSESLLKRFVKTLGVLQQSIKDIWSYAYDKPRSIQVEKQTSFDKKKQKTHSDVISFLKDTTLPWDKLSNINNKDIVWLVKYHHLVKQTNEKTKLEKIQRPVTGILKRLTKDKNLMEQLNSISPQIPKFIQNFNHDNKSHQTFNINWSDNALKQEFVAMESSSDKLIQTLGKLHAHYMTQTDPEKRRRIKNSMLRTSQSIAKSRSNMQLLQKIAPMFAKKIRLLNKQRDKGIDIDLN